MNTLTKTLLSNRVASRIGPLFAKECRLLSSQSPFSTDIEEKAVPQKSYEKTINQVTLLGRVGNEPTRKGTDDHPCVIFSLATHNNYRYESGDFVEKTDWHRVVVFKPSLRDLIYSYLKKGQRVFVQGKLTYGSITDNGVLRPTSSIIADDVIFFYQNEAR